MLLGLAGAVLPVLPSLPLVFAGYLVYGLATGWQAYGLTVMVIIGGLTVLVQGLDAVAGGWGASRYGGSRAGVWGAALGAIVGLIFFNVIGLLLGPFVGALIGELLAGRTLRAGLRSGWGAFVGFLAGTLFKIVIAAAMIGAFFYLILT